MRGTSTKIRGRIALIRSGSGLIEGVADIVGVVGPLSRSELLDQASRHGIPAALVRAGECDAWPYAWALANVVKLKRPIKYAHPYGAVIWVALKPNDQAALRRALKTRKLSRSRVINRASA